jgi:alkanesulfonate monooxygenase SsuD/methylene tetrahydromethanopterin reductase-like flavin-dependent oxidoreductase (luciferase family)
MRIGAIVPMGEADTPGRMPTWAEIREFTQAAESLGLDSVWVYEHFYSHDPGKPLLGIHEVWGLLSAIATSTTRVDLGLLVACTAYRNPGLIAKHAVTVDEISGGRLILGIGAGWHDDEYRAFGYPIDHKVSRFEEALEIIVQLMRGETVTYEGRYYDMSHAVLLPPPARRIPILIAGNRPRMLRLTARHADAWNTAWFGEPDARFEGRLADFEGALREENRDRKAIQVTVGIELEDADTEAVADRVAGLITAYANRADELIFYFKPMTIRSLERIAQGIRTAAHG